MKFFVYPRLGFVEVAIEVYTWKICLDCMLVQVHSCLLKGANKTDDWDGVK